MSQSSPARRPPSRRVRVSRREGFRAAFDGIATIDVEMLRARAPQSVRGSPFDSLRTGFDGLRANGLGRSCSYRFSCWRMGMAGLDLNGPEWRRAPTRRLHGSTSGAREISSIVSHFAPFWAVPPSRSGDGSRRRARAASFFSVTFCSICPLGRGRRPAARRAPERGRWDMVEDKMTIGQRAVVMATTGG